jgi:hypothetical protein
LGNSSIRLRMMPMRGGKRQLATIATKSRPRTSHVVARMEPPRTRFTPTVVLYTVLLVL